MKPGLLLSVFLLFSCSSGQRSWLPESTVSDAAFSRKQAERILGEPVGEVEISRTLGCIVYDKVWSYTAADAEAVNGRVGHVTVLVESHHDVEKIIAWYRSTIRTMGLTDEDRIEGIGEEAHGSTSDFRIWARKEKYMIYLAVEPKTSHTSAEEFQRVAGEVIAAL
jgi:hypothetical protein